MAAPPIGGPTLVAVQVVDSKRPLAMSRSSCRTSAFRFAPLAAAKAILAAATMTDTARSWGKLSAPSAYAAGMLISAANRVRSITTITGRLRRNSTHGPSGTATTAPAASPAAASPDTSPGPACSTRIAITETAPRPIPEPYALTAYAAQSHPNCRPSDRLTATPSTPLAARRSPLARAASLPTAIKAGPRPADQTTPRPGSHNGALCGQLAGN